MPVQAYLFFDGRCDEAIEFYKKTLGAKVDMLMRFKDAPDQPKSGEPGCGPADMAALADKVMHSSITINGTSIMMSDGFAKGQPKFEGFSLSAEAKDEPGAQKLFAALSDGGKVQQPLMKTFFSPAFGMVEDKFGVSWMVIVPQAM